MKNLVILMIITIFLCSCAPSIKRNNTNIINLKTGASQEEVVKIMGPPATSESYEAAGGERVSILYYRTEEKKTTVLSVKDECTPIIFINGKLEGWGERFLVSNINMLKVKTK